MNITLTRRSQRRTAQRALHAFKSDHARQIAKDKTGDLIAGLWVVFIVFLIVGGMVL